MSLTVGSCYCCLTSMDIRWVRRRDSRTLNLNQGTRTHNGLATASKLPEAIPVFLSTERRDVNPEELKALYEQCNRSSNRFPESDPDSGSVMESVDVDKLKIALSHSGVLVSVFCKPQHARPGKTDEDEKKSAVSGSEHEESSTALHSSRYPMEEQDKVGFLGSIFGRTAFVTPSDGRLVGFGRAVSDEGLTASLYDIMVSSPLRGMGIGKLIVRRILRSLTSRGVYDIAALCSDQERLFFRACGFGDDTLGSTTMMYTRTVETCSEEHGCRNPQTRRIGRNLLLVPPTPKTYSFFHDRGICRCFPSGSVYIPTGIDGRSEIVTVTSTQYFKCTYV